MPKKSKKEEIEEIIDDIKEDIHNSSLFNEMTNYEIYFTIYDEIDNEYLRCFSEEYIQTSEDLNRAIISKDLKIIKSIFDFITGPFYEDYLGEDCYKWKIKTIVVSDLKEK